MTETRVLHAWIQTLREKVSENLDGLASETDQHLPQCRCRLERCDVLLASQRMGCCLWVIAKQLMLVATDGEASLRPCCFLDGDGNLHDHSHRQYDPSSMLPPGPLGSVGVAAVVGDGGAVMLVVAVDADIAVVADSDPIAVLTGPFSSRAEASPIRTLCT